ncbi:Transcriptional regulatory protein WalR [Anaerolineae bacterium]|nr:Transcriptional regulatory protein WalR [Anaerolineae bacterium]
MPTRILVIEDEQPLLEEIIEWLRFEGFEPLSASSGHEGVKLALESVPDLIVSDVMMPGMDGYQVLRKLRSVPTTASIPLIFLTAKSDRLDIRYGMELGADDYITKPFNRIELLNAVHTRIQRQGTLKEQAESDLQHLRRTLIYSLPHELHTPLTGVLGIGEMLVTEADTLTASEVREMGEIVVVSGNRLHHLIKNYLLYAQIELISADPERLQRIREAMLQHPEEIIENAALQVAQQHHRMNALNFKITAGAVHISENDLDKIISELVENAFKFSKPPAPVVIEAGKVGSVYRIRVIDQGWGMTPEQIAQVGAYMQFDRTLHEQQGVGLGLHLVERLTKLYDGHLEINSVPGQGTEVCVTLPST